MSWTEFISPQITLANSESESATFGFAVARLSIGAKAKVDEAALFEILADAFTKYRLVITRWEGSHQRVPAVLAKSALAHKFELIPCPTLIYWGIDLNTVNESVSEVVSSSGIKIGLLKDGQGLDALLNKAFEGYQSHYSSNARLPSDTTLVAYRSMINQVGTASNVRGLGVTNVDGEIVGFGMHKVEQPTVSEFQLAAVLPSARGRGFYEVITRAICADAKELGCDQLVSSTQASNTAGQRVWARVGLRPILSVENCHLISGTIKS